MLKQIFLPLYCCNEICSWLNRKEELVSAMAVGYPNHTPFEQPRKRLQEVTEWMY